MQEPCLPASSPVNAFGEQVSGRRTVFRYQRCHVGRVISCQLA